MKTSIPIRTNFDISIRIVGRCEEGECYIDDVVDGAVGYIEDNVWGEVSVIKRVVSCSKEWIGLWHNP